MSVSITSWEDWDRQERPAPDPNPPMKCRWCSDRSFLEAFKHNGIWSVYSEENSSEPSLMNVCPDCVDYIESELLAFDRRKSQNESLEAFKEKNGENE